MHPIVALPYQVERPREPAFRYPHGVDCRAREVDGRQSQERLETHRGVQPLPAQHAQPVRKRQEQTGAETGVHEETHGPVPRLAELGTQREDAAADGGAGQQRKVDVARGRVAVKGKVCARHSGSPHDKDDAEVVELVAELVHPGTVVRKGVEDGG